MVQTPMNAKTTGKPEELAGAAKQYTSGLYLYTLTVQETLFGVW
jgi:hypothetical protein